LLQAIRYALIDDSGTQIESKTAIVNPTEKDLS
jgi:hypothetical protein